MPTSSGTPASVDAIQVVGAGGIGCAVGYALRAAGVPVVFVDANRAKGEAGHRGGVRVDDRPPLPVEFVHFADWQPGPGAPVLLCTKCYDSSDSVRSGRSTRERSRRSCGGSGWPG